MKSRDLANADMPLSNLASQVAVVTGGGSGLGAAIAERCAASGASVVVADISGSAAEQVVEKLNKAGGDAIAHETDVADQGSVRSLAGMCFGRFGRCDYLFNNAGIAVFKPLLDCSEEEWQKLIAVNIMGVVNGVQAFAPAMIERQQGGQIINIASMAGLVPLEGLGIYTATKHAVVGYSNVLAQELSARGIAVSAVCPGWIATAIQEPEEGAPRPHFPEELSRVISAKDAADLILANLNGHNHIIATHPEWSVAVHDLHREVQSAFQQD